MESARRNFPSPPFQLKLTGHCAVTAAFVIAGIDGGVYGSSVGCPGFEYVSLGSSSATVRDRELILVFVRRYCG